MCLVKTVFAVLACTSLTKYVFVSSQDEPITSEVDTEKTEPPPLESHTFVALIDIAFADGNKRRCTGTIIHDNVIITAAHCFLNHGNEYTDVELSGSFIVIGTKKMFETGYENYLPIERVITHPKYRGWTADLALVFTYAGMTTDKPGNLIPLVEESEATPVDSNVTILSWGNCCDERNRYATKYPSDKKRRCTSSEEGDSCEPAPRRPLREGTRSKENESEEVHTGPTLQQNNSRHRSFQAKDKASSLTTKVMTRSTTLNSDEISTIIKAQKDSQDNDPDASKDTKETEPALSLRSPMELAQGKKKVNTTKANRKRRYEKAYRNVSSVQVQESPEKEQDWGKLLETVIQRSGLNISMDEGNATKSLKDYRRKVHKSKSVQDSTLTIETFGFVNVQTCKKLIEKSLPKLYRINTNEVVCYSAEEHFISDDDSGAPAVREGRLVAVTVGGAECEGDHVAVGMKMTCFCSWILENLPPGEHKLNCCTGCCGEENKKEHNKKEEKKDPTYLRAHIQKRKSHKKQLQEK